MTGRVWFGAFSGLCVAGLAPVPSAVLAAVAAGAARAWVGAHGPRNVDN